MEAANHRSGHQARWLRCAWISDLMIFGLRCRDDHWRQRDPLPDRGQRWYRRLSCPFAAYVRI